MTLPLETPPGAILRRLTRRSLQSEKRLNGMVVIAVALGAFYRPNEDVMLSLGGSTGGGENMVNVGATFKLGQHNHVSNSRVAMAKEIRGLKELVAKHILVQNHQLS